VAQKQHLHEVYIKNETESMVTFANHMFPSERSGSVKIFFLGQIKLLAEAIEKGIFSLLNEVPNAFFEMADVAVPVFKSKVEPVLTDYTVAGVDIAATEATTEATTEAATEVTTEATTEVTTEATTEATTEVASTESLESDIASNEPEVAVAITEGQVLTGEKVLTSDIVEAYEKKNLLSIAKQLGIDANRDTTVPVLKTLIKEFIANLPAGTHITIDDSDPSSIIVGTVEPAQN
jgi:hypothetical protein